MIVKFNKTQDININKNKFILFYGVNEGLKKEEIAKLTIKEKKENIISGWQLINRSLHCVSFIWQKKIN